MFGRHLKFLSILFLLMAATVDASDAYTAVASFFAEYDKMLEQTAVKAQKVTSLNATEKMFQKKIQDYYCATYFMRTNSKGKIISKVTEAGIQPRDFRYIGKQKWFEIISMTNKPYYGYTKNRSAYYLFWNKPIHVRRKGKLYFGGSISAKINMKKSFLTIAAEEDVVFKVKLRSKTLFSNLPKGTTNLITKPLSVGGLPVLTISYPSGGVAAVEAETVAAAPIETKESSSSVESTKSSKTKAVKVKTSKSSKTEMKKDNAKAKNEVKEAKAKEEKTADNKSTVEGEAKKLSLAPVIFFSAIFLAIIICIFVLIAQVRHKKLLEAIDNDEF